MKFFITQISIYLLLLSSVRFAVLIKGEIEQVALNKRESLLFPHDSSLNGVDAGGHRVTVEVGPDGHLKNKEELLIFVVHRRELANEIQFWNRVIDLIPTSRLKTSAPIRYWGICDEGSGCNSSQADAHFAIIGYLDPYQMHIVAEADSRREALLYDPSMALKARIDSNSNPLIEANLAIQQMR